MNISKAELDELVPASDAATALLRMPAKGRLPKFRANSLVTGVDAPETVKDALRNIGR